MDVPQLIAGRFRIEREIGTGGMGTVYLATQVDLERPVAVKIIKRECAGDADVADRFLREARTMAKLRHPNAAMIFDAGNLPDGRHFIVMEFVEGETLSQALAREGRFPASKAVNIATQICDVLEEAHRLGIVHRDLKPSNILLGKRGVCVLDFGVAKVLASSAESTFTHASTGSGQLIGTPRYMSPEQYNGFELTPATDVYSLGVILYEMLTGMAPFTGATREEIAQKHANDPPHPPRGIVAAIPEDVERVVLLALEKRPEDRPANADEFRQELLDTAERLGLEHHALKSAPDIEALRDAGVESPSGRLVVDISRLREKRALSSGSTEIKVMGESSVKTATPEKPAKPSSFLDKVKHILGKH